jgi:predicted transcriptional regulator
MSAREIKNLLHESIENINDEALLLTIKELVERQYTPKAAVGLTDWQTDRIEESKRQIKAGQTYPEKEADDIIDQWLSE